MLTQYALIISIVLQFAATVIVVSLIRATKYNSSWILLSIALFVMAIRRVIGYLPYTNKELTEQVLMLNSWLGVIISLLMLVGMLYVKKVLNHMFKLEEVRASADKRLLNTIIITEENERRRLARELHDGLGPLLSSVKMSVSAISSGTNPGNQSEIIHNVIQSINESINTLKEISNNLSPHILDNFGLPAAIRAFIDKLEQAGEMRFDFRDNIGSRRYPGNTEIIVYRVVCELINNTLKHAGADKVLISLDQEDDQLLLLYQDDGKGFDQEKLALGENKGMGLSNIRSRINSLNGRFEIESWPGEGIIVTVVIKIQNNNPAESN
ncbi:MAG TPA: sensor histidine kinase [Bacteroidales bacterium]|nr:sensor histidine kinase [Bacteroidales bacterium]